MKIQKILTVLLFLLYAGSAKSQATDEVRYIYPEKAYRYRVYFTDKNNSPYSLKRPEMFLSKKALQRREKLNIKVDEYDLPVSPVYLKYLDEHHFKVVNVSKWNNTAVVEINDTSRVKELAAISFVKLTRKVWESLDSIRIRPETNRFAKIENKLDTLDIPYGFGHSQISQLNAIRLHEAGFRGEGMSIAVIDGGFYNADSAMVFQGCNILGTRNFVHPNRSVYEEPQDHGTMVLSCISAHLPYIHIGTAPNASFYLLQSEDTESEQMVEEDNWCAAVEYADSLGVDIITSSLGYYKFDDSETSHKYHELDGLTAVNSRSASLAASRGILVLNSAGNEGDSPWKKIGFPADAIDILSVGAVNSKGINTNFSSIGNTADGRIKPDAMARGQFSMLFDHQGNLTAANGTSFSCPILCGAVACLWQAFPEKHPTDIIEAVRQSGNYAEHPNNIYGYGIPDMWKAYEILKQPSHKKKKKSGK